MFIICAREMSFVFRFYQRNNGFFRSPQVLKGLCKSNNGGDSIEECDFWMLTKKKDRDYNE